MSDEWDRVKTALPVGKKVHGTVLSHHPFGVFVQIDDIAFKGLVAIPDFKESGQRMTPEEYPPIGSEVEAVVLGFRDSNNQIGLGMRPSQMAKAGL